MRRKSGYPHEFVIERPQKASQCRAECGPDIHAEKFSMTTPFLFCPVFSWPAAPGGLLYTYSAGGTVAKATYFRRGRGYAQRQSGRFGLPWLSDGTPGIGGLSFPPERQYAALRPLWDAAINYDTKRPF